MVARTTVNPLRPTSVPQIPEIRSGPALARIPVPGASTQPAQAAQQTTAPPATGNLPDVVRALKELVEVREGISGDPLDRVVTFRDLYTNGLLNTSGAVPRVQIPSVTGLLSLPPVPSVSSEFLPPPAVGNLVAIGALANVLLTFDTPVYTGHAYTEIWRAGTDDLGAAALIGTTNSGVYADNLGETGATRYYWARNVNQANVSGPYNAVAGTSATTGVVESTDLASTIKAIEIVAALPTLPDASYPQGAVVFLTSDNKLYRSTGAAWTSVVPTTDLTGQVTTTQITDNAITTAKVAANAITANELAANSVIAGKIAAAAIVAGDGVISNAAIATAQIQDAAITNAKIGLLAVDTANIANLAVATGKIADLAVTNAKIANLSVDTGKIADLTVTAAKIADATITTAKIGTAQITTALIADAAITNAKIGDAEITGAKIQDAEITNAKIANLTITGGKIAAGTITVDKLSSQVHQITGLTFTSNSPGAGSVAWTAHTIQYNGSTYSIGSGNTSSEMIWLDRSVSTTALQGSTRAAFESAYNPADGDILLAVNTSGTFEQVYNATQITGNAIKTGTITAGKLSVTQLSAVTADMGSITAGNITLDTSGFIKGGQTAYDTGTGFFLGYSTGYKFSIGNSAGNKLTWDGSTLAVTGSITDQRPYAAGSNIIAAAGEEAFTQQTTYTRLKEISVVRSGTLTVAFDLQGTGASIARGQIFKNGVAVGTERSTSTPSVYTTWSENISVAAGDLIQIYAKTTGAGSAAYVKNYRLKNSFIIAEVATYNPAGGPLT